MMKVLILANHSLGLYKFRRELLEEMLRQKFRVAVSVPEGEFLKDMISMGCKIVPDRYLERHGTNPVHDVRLFCHYRRLIRRFKPDVVLTYTIKPNIYGGIVCTLYGVPYIANITGLGTSIENKGVLQFVSAVLYRIGLRKAKKVFFQNQENYTYMLKHHMIKKHICEILPGSGVNTLQHCYEPYPESEEKMVFTVIGRITKDKGIDEVLEAAEKIKGRYPDIVFRLIGDFDEGYKDRVKVQRFQKAGIVEHLPLQKDIHPFIAESHAIIHASYHEGMSNVLLEAAATGRPVIATDVHGCIETFEPDATGIAFKAKDSASLIAAIERFIALPNEKRAEMGRRGRRKMEQEFDRRIVVEKYMKEIHRISEGK